MIYWFGTKFIGYTLYQQGFPNSSVGKEPTCNAGDPGSIPGSGRYPGEGIGYPLQYSGLDNFTGGHKESDTTERLSLSFCSLEGKL